MTWTRRDVLRALGVGASAPLVAPLLQACGGPPRRPAAAGMPARPMAVIRAQLRDLVADLSRTHEQATGMAALRVRGGAAFDGNTRDADAAASATAVLAATRGGLRLEEATTDVSAAGLRQAADRLAARAGGGSRRPALDFGAPRDVSLPVVRDPRTRTPQQWLREVEALHARARRVGGSRIVYRGAYLTVEQLEQVVVGAGIDLGQRLVRSRAGVLLVAWTGAEPTAEDASRAGTIGLEAIDALVDEDDSTLEEASGHALEQLTARGLDRSDGDLVLDPTCTAMIARRALAPALDAARWLAGTSRATADRALGAPAVTLVDDPTAAGGFGSYSFDDEGTPASRTVLVDAGQLAAPYTDLASAAALKRASTGNGRRARALEPARPAPSNLALAAGELEPDQLLAGVDRGLLLEGALSVDVDLHSWRFALRAARARGVDKGRKTGALYRAVDLRGDLRALLAGVRGAGKQLGTYAVVDGGLAMQATGPGWLTRGEVRGA